MGSPGRVGGARLSRGVPQSCPHDWPRRRPRRRDDGDGLSAAAKSLLGTEGNVAAVPSAMAGLRRSPTSTRCPRVSGGWTIARITRLALQRTSVLLPSVLRLLAARIGAQASAGANAPPRCVERPPGDPRKPSRGALWLDRACAHRHRAAGVCRQGGQGARPAMLSHRELALFGCAASVLCNPSRGRALVVPRAPCMRRWRRIRVRRQPGRPPVRACAQPSRRWLSIVLTMLRCAGSVATRRSIFLTALITVEWSRPEKRLPISG